MVFFITNDINLDLANVAMNSIDRMFCNNSVTLKDQRTMMASNLNEEISSDCTVFIKQTHVASPNLFGTKNLHV